MARKKNRKGVERAYKKSFEYRSGKIPSELKSLFIEDIVPEDGLEEDALESFPEPAKAEGGSRRTALAGRNRRATGKPC